MDFVGDGLEAVGDGLRHVGNATLDGLRAAGEWVGDAIETVGEGLVAIGNQIGQVFGSIEDRLAGFLTDHCETLYNWLDVTSWFEQITGSDDRNAPTVDPVPACLDDLVNFGQDKVAEAASFTLEKLADFFYDIMVKVIEKGLSMIGASFYEIISTALEATPAGKALEVAKLTVHHACYNYDERWYRPR